MHHLNLFLAALASAASREGDEPVTDMDAIGAEDDIFGDDSLGEADLVGTGSGFDLVGTGSGLDLVGAGEELLGAEDEYIGDDLVGAARKILAVAARGRGTPVGHPAALRQAAYNNARVGVLGLGSQTLAGAGSWSLTGRPQKPFRVDRLVLADSVAGNSTITAVNVGVDPEFVNNAGAPVAIFGAGAFGVALRGKTAAPGMDVVCSGTMAAAGTISGGIVGRYAE